jgi:MFS family permease
MLFFANFTSQLGSVVGMTAFMLYLLRRFSHQPVYATITELMYSLPTLVVFFLVGVVADRVNRKKVAYYCDYISAVLSLALLISVMNGFIVLTFAILFLRSGISKFFQPAETALLQGILKKDEYAVSAGLNQMISSIFMLFGGAIGTFVFWNLGIEAAIITDVVSFLLSGLLISACKIPAEVTNPNGNHSLRDLNVKIVFKDFKEGFLYIINYPLLRSLIVAFILFGVINGGFAVMPMFIMKYKFAPDSYEEMMIYVGIVFGVAVLAGSILGSILVKKFSLQNLIIIGLISTGLGVFAAGFSPNIILYFTSIGFAGLALPICNIGMGGWFPQIVDRKMMGRVQGWINPINMLFHSLTLGVIALIYPTYLKIEWIHAIVGISLAIVGVYFAIILPKFNEEKSTAKVELEKGVSQ